jgi:DinB superfamily
MGPHLVPMTTGVDILRSAFSASCDTVRRVLTGVTTDEFFWEPVAGCWTVHRRSEARGVSADGSGEWVIDYDPAQPQPPPFTTIAWRTVHIAGVNYLYWDYAFGSASLSFDLEMPGDVAEATDWLFASHEPLLDALSGLSDADLDRQVPTNWGDQWPMYRIFATLINEQVHHGAEISMVRDLYRYRDTLTSRA